MEVNEYIKKRYPQNFETKKRKAKGIEKIKQDGDIYRHGLLREQQRNKFYLELANFDISRLKYLESMGIVEFNEYFNNISAESARRRKQQNPIYGGSKNKLRGKR